MLLKKKVIIFAEDNMVLATYQGSWVKLPGEHHLLNKGIAH